MKRLIIFLIPMLMVLALFQNSYAKTYYRTFEVAEITGEGIVLKDFEGGRFLVEKDPGNLQVGDLVRYDTVRNRLKKSPWQPATRPAVVRVLTLICAANTSTNSPKANRSITMRQKARLKKVTCSRWMRNRVED